MAASVELKSQGNAAFQAGKFEEAIKFFTEAIALSPKDHVLYSNRSGAYASLKNFEKALEDADKCVELNPQWPKGYSRKGLAELNMGLLREAEQTYTLGLRVDPQNASLLEGLKDAQSRGNSMIEMQALMAASQAIRKYPKLSKYQEEDPEYLPKLVDIIKEIHKNPNNLRVLMAQPDVRIKEGVTAALGGKLEEDDEPVKIAPRPSQKTEVKPPPKELTPEEQRAEAKKNEGNEFYKAKKFDEALACYDEAIELNPHEILYMCNKAAAYMEMGAYDKCIAECQSALDKRYDLKADFSKVAKVFNRMGACFLREKKFDEAINAYEKSLCEDNTRHTRLALAEVKRQKEKSLKDAYLDPVKAEEHRQRGNDLFKEQKFPEAKKEYDEAIRRNPKDAKLFSNRAAALTKLFEYPSALKDVDVALELDPLFVKAWSRKGSLHALLKEYSKALEAFDKGLAIEPENRECQDGKMNVIYKVQKQQMSGEIDEEQMRHSMADPEIQQILRDPQMSIVLSNLQENPQLLKDYMKDPKIQNGINKLITAGILRVG